MNKYFEKIKERVCEFIHERNKSGSVPCKNQRASCFQLIRVCDLTAIVNQVEEEFATDTNVGSNSSGKLTSSEWIPCSERLPNFSPKKWRKVLVTLEDPAGKRFPTTAKYNEEYKQWYEFNDCRYHDFKVVAWMPLPEPYKESED